LLRRLGSNNDYRNPPAIRAFDQTIAHQPADALCLSVGGGPTREHPNLVNVNIGPFPNVDVVADAYALPYADGCVSGVFCEAVLEHLEFPEAAVREMFRVLQPGGQLFAATPFLQAYHGYPNHFQNFTQTGHERLFLRAGFELISSGTCVGPSCVIADLTVKYVQNYVGPRWFQRGLAAGLSVFMEFIRRRDRHLNYRPDAAIIASTTYAHLRKAH